MTRHKQRLTVTVDPELIETGNRAVASGEADSLSGWVSAAIVDKVQRDRTLASLRAAIVDYEAEYGEITVAEIAAQRRADRQDAVVVRGGGSGASSAAGNAGEARSA
jgi:ribonuclease HII